ncbi:MAG: DUF2092 domain-containing protein [Pirellulaceae bacterium]
MNRPLLSLALVSLALVGLLATPATAQIIATPKAQASAADSAAGAAKLNAVVGQALQFLGQAENYVLTVESKWQASGDAPGQAGQSNYRLVSQGKKHRIEVQAADAKSPQLVCVNDGQQVTTLLVAQGLYSQHAVGTPQASLESNQMLAQSLAGSAIDILLQPNVGQYVHAQASGIVYHGVAKLAGQPCHRFELEWSGAQVELWFAAEGDPLLVQFVRTAAVPTSEDDCYELVHTARFAWQLNAKFQRDPFALALPREARRVNDIYDALSGDDPAARIGQPLPKMQLTQLDGGSLDLSAAAHPRGMVLIFWATWCTPSVADMAAVSQFVKASQEQGIDFYAVNVGEEPGAVRRFIDESPLASAVALDPKGRASSALRVTQLPAAVVVNPDGTVRALLTGTAKEVQAKVAAELATMLGKPGAKANTARRPQDVRAPK